MRFLTYCFVSIGFVSAACLFTCLGQMCEVSLLSNVQSLMFLLWDFPLLDFTV